MINQHLEEILRAVSIKPGFEETKQYLLYEHMFDISDCRYLARYRARELAKTDFDATNYVEHEGLIYPEYQDSDTLCRALKLAGDTFSKNLVFEAYLSELKQLVVNKELYEWN